MHLAYFLGCYFYWLLNSAGFLPSWLQPASSESDTMGADRTLTCYKISQRGFGGLFVFIFFFFYVCTAAVVFRLLLSGIVTTRMSDQ